MNSANEYVRSSVDNSSVEDYTPNQYIANAVDQLIQAHQLCIIEYNNGDINIKRKLYPTIVQLRELLEEAQKL